MLLTAGTSAPSSAPVMATRGAQCPGAASGRSGCPPCGKPVPHTALHASFDAAHGVGQQAIRSGGRGVRSQVNGDRHSCQTP